jgi:serine/threonine protein kinase
VSSSPGNAAELRAGDALGPYRLEAVLGEGGMGLVFRARHETDDATVALKVLKIDLSQDLTYRQRFLHEARAAAEVRHENLVAILDAGEIDGRPFLAVAYVHGRTLEDHIKTEGRMPLEAVLRLADEVAAGLDALHERDLVHRDVKASNIMISDDGAAALTDFGLAKGSSYTVLTRPGQVLGTLDYMAPELIKGHAATPASDIYAFGCTMYECAVGHTPFSHRSGFQIGIAHLDEDPPDPGAELPDWPPDLSSALLAALQKEPERRPPSAGEYARALRAAVPHP